MLDLGSVQYTVSTTAFLFFSKIIRLCSIFIVIAIWISVVEKDSKNGNELGVGGGLPCVKHVSRRTHDLQEQIGGQRCQSRVLLLLLQITLWLDHLDELLPALSIGTMSYTCLFYRNPRRPTRRFPAPGRNSEHHFGLR